MKVSRRDFLHFAVSGAAAAGVFAVFKAAPAAALPRPPGALEEVDFLSRCSRCGICIDVCQPMALRPAGVLEGFSAVGTPVMDVRRCIVCMECIRKCPTGALSKVPKTEVDIGTAVILPDLCLALLKKKRCQECYKACPEKAVEMEQKRYPKIIAEKCNGCGICVRRCPTDPKSVVISYEGSRRHSPPDRRFLVRLEDRVGPYEFQPPDFKTWFANRVRTLAEHYGMKSR